MRSSLKSFCKRWLAQRRLPKQPRRTVLNVERLDERCLLAAGASLGGTGLGQGREFYVAPGGDDWNDGSLNQPFQTIRRALDAAIPGDIITLRNGVYEGGINIDLDNLTIRSMPGEWAVVESPISPFGDGHAESVFRYGWDVEGGLLQNLEVTGGYYYGVMMWDWWDPTWEPGTTHRGASGITLDGLKIHDTGVDAVKITPGADDIRILNCEIYNAGRRTTSSADGIDNNNGDRMIARGNYIHDIPGIGVLTTGGTRNSVIEQNFIQNTGGAGLTVGFYSEAEWMEPATNPLYFTSIDTVARNNIIVDAGHAGIGIYASDNGQVYNNTIVNAAEDAQAPIQFGGIELWLSDADWNHHVASDELLVVNNIITTDPSNDTRMIDIRQGSFTGQLTLDHNLYHGTNNRGILFIDRNLTGDGTPEQAFSQWQANYGYDANSMLADPQLGADWHLLATSPAVGKAIALAGLANDFDGNPRDAEPDLGADELGAGANRVIPPAPFGAPSLEIGSRAYHDYEANTINVRVLRHGSADAAVTVQFATMDGSAKAGQDYVGVAGTLTFAPGEVEKVVAVALLADGLPEGDEHFLFTLSNPTTDGAYPVRLGHQSSASMTIDDAETPITLHYATKWVSNDGSDVNGDGSQARPWKSLQHAADNVGPGDYVIVMPGRYWGMNMTRDGKPDARITFHALPGVLIDEPNPENRLDGINLEGADFVTVEGFEVHDMPRAGLRSVNNDGVILRGNFTDHNTMWGILTGWSENIVIENNVASRSQVEHGIYVSNSADGAVVRNNIVWGNRASGIQFNADRYLPGDGVHSRNLVEGNVIYENGRGGGAALNFDGFQDSIVRNNLLYNNHATGIVLYVGFAADSSTNNLVVNNTVVMAEDARWALLMTDGSSGNTLVNNILLNKNPNRGSMTVEHNSLPALSDHNVVQDLFQLDGYNGTFAGWQAFSGGHDANSIVVAQADVLTALNSLFVDPANNDYHLKVNSPAIDVGDPFHAPAVDIFQHARPSGAGVDIGAYETGNFQPAVQFEWNDVAAYEFIGMAEVAVTRTGDTEGWLAVEIASSHGTAGADDYMPSRGYLVFRPGETRKTFRVFVNDDAAIESPETVQLDLRAVGDPIPWMPTNQVGDPIPWFPTDQVGDPTGLFPPVQVGDPIPWLPTDQATLHILSDDAWRPGSFEFDASSVTFDETAGTATVTVHRVGGSNGDVSINFATDSFTPPRQATWVKRHTDLLYPTDRDTPATAEADYLAQHGTLNFADGETSKTITIPLVNDDWYEGGEAFVLRLSDPTDGAALGTRSQLKVRIESEDVKLPGTFVFATPTYSVTEGTPFVNVTVNRVGGGNVEASVRLYNTGAGNGTTLGSAWAPSDHGSIPEMLTFAPGEMSKTFAIPIVDDSSTENAEAFSLRLYSPSNDAAVGDPATTIVTILDNESTFSFETPGGSGNWTVKEGDDRALITVVRRGATVTPASVRIRTSEWASATPGVDFAPMDVTLHFGPGETSRFVEVKLINDAVMEPKESFPVSMSECVGAEQGSWTAAVNILDDDVALNPGTLQLSSTSYSVSENAGQLLVTVQRVGGSDGMVSVRYRTQDGAPGVGSDQTAWAGSDYTSTSGIVTFGPGETSKTFAVPIRNDSSIEKNEKFQVVLSSPTGGAVLGSAAKAVVTIVEDDSAIQFGSTSIHVNPSAGFITLTLVRRGSTKGAASVNLRQTWTTASGGIDLGPAGLQVLFADGEEVKTVQIALVPAKLKPQTEYFGFTLTNAVGAALGSSLWATATVQGPI